MQMVFWHILSSVIESYFVSTFPPESVLLLHKHRALSLVKVKKPNWFCVTLCISKEIIISAVPDNMNLFSFEGTTLQPILCFLLDYEI